MGQHTFTTHSVVGGGVMVYLDMDARDYCGRVRGVVKFYDMRYTGDAPRGSQGEGFTVDGQFISSYYAEEFKDKPKSGLDLNGGVPSWKLEKEQYLEAWEWIREKYENSGEEIPEYIIPMKFS